MNKPIFSVAIVCILTGFAQGLASEVPGPKSAITTATTGKLTPDDSAFLKQFRLKAKFTKVIGTFSRYIGPTEGSCFEIDLSQPSWEALKFSIVEKGYTSTHSDLTFTPPLKPVRLERHNFSEGSGGPYASIYLAAESPTRKTLVNIVGKFPPSESNNRFYLYLFQESHGDILGMAEAWGTVEKIPEPVK